MKYDLSPEEKEEKKRYERHWRRIGIIFFLIMIFLCFIIGFWA